MRLHSYNGTHTERGGGAARARACLEERERGHVDRLCSINGRRVAARAAAAAAAKATLLLQQLLQVVHSPTCVCMCMRACVCACATSLLCGPDDRQHRARRSASTVGFDVCLYIGALPYPNASQDDSVPRPAAVAAALWPACTASRSCLTSSADRCSSSATTGIRGWPPTYTHPCRMSLWLCACGDPTTYLAVGGGTEAQQHVACVRRTHVSHGLHAIQPPYLVLEHLCTQRCCQRHTHTALARATCLFLGGQAQHCLLAVGQQRRQVPHACLQAGRRRVIRPRATPRAALLQQLAQCGYHA
jgi:hypothetical protein